MERYSDRAIEIINELHTERLDHESEYLLLIDCANRCASYEDTGLEPDGIDEALNEAYDLGYQACLNYKGSTWSEAAELQAYRALGTVEELSAWKQAVDLVGKSYYTVYDGEDEASIGAIDAVEFREDGIFLMDNGEISRLDEVGQNVDGKTVFLTCVEAEAALSAKEGDDHETDPV